MQILVSNSKLRFISIHINTSWKRDLFFPAAHFQLNLRTQCFVSQLDLDWNINISLLCTCCVLPRKTSSVPHDSREAEVCDSGDEKK